MYDVSIKGASNTVSTDKKEEQQAAQDKATLDDGTNVPLTDTRKRELIASLKQNWQREMEGVRTYSDLARNERDATRRAVLVKMAVAEARHAHRHLGEKPIHHVELMNADFSNQTRRNLLVELAQARLVGRRKLRAGTDELGIIFVEEHRLLRIQPERSLSIAERLDPGEQLRIEVDRVAIGGELRRQRRLRLLQGGIGVRLGDLAEGELGAGKHLPLALDFQCESHPRSR